MRGTAFSFQTQTQFFVETCYKCGVMFAVDAQLQSNWKRDKTEFFCPNGHGQSYFESEAERLRKQLEEATRTAEWQKSRAESLDKQLTDSRKKEQRLKKRIAAGVCPCCHRTVKQLAAHMKTKHPDYTDMGKK